MTFVHPLLLGGLLLVGIPVLLHLIMRQKPKHLLFPAFRFLLQKHRTNQRRLKLRHFLLLLLRMLLIAGVCLALARPKVFNERLQFATDRPLIAVVIVDTSPSMEYAVAGVTRLEEAKRRAQDLLASMPASSRVAVLDTGDVASGHWHASPARAGEQVAGLQIRTANGPVNGQLMEAYRLLEEPDPREEDGQEKLPRFVYLFTDRAANSWDDSRLRQLEEMRKRLPPPPEVNEVLFDVGADKPADLAITQVELPRQAVPANVPVVLNVSVQATGVDYDTEVLCSIDAEKKPLRQPLRLAAGQSQVIRFERSDLAPGLHQAEITLASGDNLPFNNVAYATFEVRGPRQVLVICDRPGDEKIRGDAARWTLTLKHAGFKAEVLSTTEAGNLSPRELAAYPVICLLNVSKPSAGLWERLEKAVIGGAGLAAIPGGEDMDNDESRKAWNEEPAAQRLLPGRLLGIVNSEEETGAVWREATYQHPALAPFREWRQLANTDFVKFPPRALRYWEVEAAPDQDVLGQFDDKPARPALLERKFDRTKVRGRVLLFAMTMDGRHLSEKDQREWNTFEQTSFCFCLTRQTVGYLAGNMEDVNLNFRCGQAVPIYLPAEPRFPTYSLFGPGLAGSDVQVTREDRASTLAIRQAIAPGFYTLQGPEGRWKTGFSLMLGPDESQLAKVPDESIARLLGKDGVVPLTKDMNLRDALQTRWPTPVELLPWLMILVLLALAFENLLANKFYRREPPSPEGGAP